MKRSRKHLLLLALTYIMLNCGKGKGCSLPPQDAKKKVKKPKPMYKTPSKY